MSHYALSGRVDELTDGTVGSVDAAMGAPIGPYWKSRSRWRGLETGSRQPYTGTKLETADTARGEPTGHRASPRPYYAPSDGRWFRRELEEMAYDTLLRSCCPGRGLFRQEAVRQLLDEHVSGQAE
jgi:hypothetical protein